MIEIIKKEKNSRALTFKTKSGVINTPFFMPDATRGFVKSIGLNDLNGVGMGPMVVNTYHLYLQPGMELVRQAGGVHKFMNWDKPLLSDSGGYQVFSLIHKNPKMGKVTEDEVIFKSPLDGSMHKITPEKAIEIQFDLGVDMMVCLDDPCPNDYPKEKIAAAVERTIRWALRCKEEYLRQIEKRGISEENRPLIFGVIQGGEYLDLRHRCTDGLAEIGFDGYGFGARHVDSDGNFLSEVLEYTASIIPENALRFALGVGTPMDIVKCHSYGWDMFDCVIPTREGRHGKLFVWKKDAYIQSDDFYETVNINNEKFREDFSPLDADCGCELCKNYSLSYLQHLFRMKEPLGMRLAAIHNLKFYMELMEKLRNF